MAQIKNGMNNPIMSVLLALLFVSGISLLGVLTYNQVKAGRYIGRPEAKRDTITIQGEGKVTAVPDIGQITVSIVTQDKDVAKAQEKNIEQFNALVEAMKKEGVDKADLTTSNYTVYPNYDYTNGQQTFRNYEVRQSLAVKIRQLDNAGRIITIAGQNGVNEVSGLSFTIDDPEQLRELAREKALVNAQAKAERLAKLAGVSLGKIVSFSESTGGATPPPIYYAERADLGVGGGSFKSEPQFEAGSQDIIVDATIEYEIY